MDPDESSTSLLIQRIKVDLPAPLGPIIATKSFSPTSFPPQSAWISEITIAERKVIAIPS